MLTASAQGIYDFTVKDDFGREVSLSRFRGQVVLIVNTATRCDFTPQYEELEALYEKYHAARRHRAPFRRFTSFAPSSSTSTSRSLTRLR